MLLFGITGGIGHGKSTLAAALANQRPEAARHFETFELIAEVGNSLNRATKQLPDSASLSSINKWLEPLPAILAQTVHARVSFAQIAIPPNAPLSDDIGYIKLIQYIEAIQKDPSLLHREINITNKQAYRPLLQWLGGHLVAKVYSGIWYKEIIRRIQTAKATGCQLATIGGVRYPNDALLVREAGGYILEVTRPGFPDADTSDPTESNRQNIVADSKVINNGTVVDLELCATAILSDAESEQLQKTYITKS